MVKVKAANEAMVVALIHPINKVGFTDLNTAVIWPDDQFTTRRIMDGDVILDEDTPPDQQKTAAKAGKTG